MKTDIPRNLYVHVPYCNGKCRYCAFYSLPVSPHADFAESVCKEISLRSAAGQTNYRTVYVGGGTPSLLGEDGLARLCMVISDACGGTAPEEWTVECNPGSLTNGVAVAMIRGGVSRISIGAQSFDKDSLAVLGRGHSAQDTLMAFKTVRAAGFRSIGLDLIAGVPGTTANSWRHSLETAVSLDPDHISVYTLTVEAGTVLEKMILSQELKLPDDDEMLDTIASTEDFLSAEGFGRYEISNYARPGRECLHNLAVWRGEDYLGIGASASSRIGLLRRTNASDLDGWRAALAAGCLPPAKEEQLSSEENARERCLTGLRLSEGVFIEGALDKFRALEKLSLVEKCDEDRWRLTRRGREVADSVAMLF